MTSQAKFPLLAWLSAFTTIYDTGGQNFYIDCPVCGGRKKCGVHREKALFHCFRCNEGGHGGDIWSGKSDLLGFAAIVENLSIQDARSFLGSLQGMPDIPPPKKKIVSTKMPKGDPVSSLWEDHLARRYLKRRGVEHLIESALYVEYHKVYHDRIVFPTAYLDRSTGFEARALLDTQWPKSLFPEWQDTLSVYTTRPWENTGRIVVTESMLDAETFHGIEDAVGCYGVFTPNQLESILALDAKAIVWAMDADQNHRLREFLSYTFGMVDNFVLRLSGKEDPNSIGTDECKRRLDNAVHVKTMWDVYDLFTD